VAGQPNLPILNDVACELRLQPDGALRVKGKGAASTGGSLNMDMQFWPEDLRADGRVSLSALPLTLFVPVLPSVPWYEPEKSRLHAELTIKAESPARVSLDGYADLRNVSLAADRLASTPVQNISLSIAGRGHWLPMARRLEIDTGSIGLGKARAEVKGAVELTNDHYAFDIAASMPPTPCTEAVRSIPSALLGDMALAQWRGAIARKLRFQTDSRELDKTELKVDITDRCDFQIVPVIADLSRFARPFVHTVTEPDGTVFEMETGPGTPNWTPIEAMSPYFVHAVLVHEDPQFFSHHGFSPLSIRNALVRDLRERRYAVGASTISMQLVKNVFLHREKTLARKIQEVLLTWWTERVMDKRDILELYLNVIEYGPSIYGIRNAALHYWNRLPAELSPAEGVFLATILPNPKHFHSYYTRNAVPYSWQSNMRKFMQRLGERGAYDKDAMDYGLQEIEHFKFSRDGQAAVPRNIAGATAPLPYQQTFKQQDTYDTSTFGAAPHGFD
jgi:penicillin-binding protein 1A